MMKRLPHILLCLLTFFGVTTATQAQLLPNLGGQRAGISALTFLKSDISPRSLALGGANIALTGDGMAASHNPALIAQNENLHLSISDLVIGAGMHQAWFSGIYPFSNSTSALGVSMNYFSSGAMEVRTEFQPEGTGQYFYANQFATGLSYSKVLSDRFSFGTTLKLVHEQLASYSNTTVTADLGFLYTTDVKDLKFGIVVKNFGGSSALSGDEIEVDFNRNGVSLDNYTVPTIFRLGASMVPYKTDDQSLMVAIQLEHPNDNSENLRFGLEYEFKKLLFVRLGYKLNVQHETLPTMGFGYKLHVGRHSMMVNYGVNITDHIGSFHGFGLDIAINRDKRE